MKKTIATTLAGCALWVACGGNKEPPATPAPSAADAEAPAPSPSPSGADTSDAAAPAPTVAAPAAAPSDAGAAGPQPVGVEMKDECTPVGVDFEKRARPKLKECYRTGKKKDANLAGTVKIKVTVDVKGKIKAVKVVEKTLPNPVADCMLKVIKETPFPEVDKCWDSTLTIPITFPTPQ
jgi:hypothetical protein